jgi:hypothetical protein
MLDRLRLLNTKHLFLAMLFIHILPIWIFRYFPSQDGMNHVYNAYLLKEYHNPTLYKTREIFQLNLTLFPNWMSHLIMAGLMFIVPPLIAEKILLTICIAIVPFSFLYFLRGVNRDSTLYVWLGFTFSYNYLLFMGFYNFALSFGLFFLTVGYWWRHRSDLTPGRIGVLYLMLIALYLCHISSYALTLIAIGLGAVWTFRRPKPVAVCAGYMLPAGFILLNYLLRDVRGLPYRYESGAWLWEYFWKNRSLVYFNDDYVWGNLVLQGMIGLLILWTIWSDKIQPRKPISNNDLFLLLSTVYLLLFWKLPREIGPGGWINERAHIFWIPVLLPWLATRFPKVVKRALIGCMVVISLIHLGYTCRDMGVYNRVMAKFIGVTELPDHIVYTRLDSDNWGPLTKYVLPYFNGFVSYGFKGDRAYIRNYEAQFNYFPINFKGDNRRDHYEGDVIQYLIGWNVADDSPRLKPYLRDYDLIFSNGYVKVLRHKLFAPPKERAWDRLAEDGRRMRFVMGDAGGTPAPGTYLVTPELRYRAGGYGWDTLSPRQAFNGGVRDSEDAAFRIDLPNGRYEVRCRFRSDDDRPHRIAMYINGARAGKPFVVPASGVEIERTWQIVVDNGTLILLIHSLDRGKNPHWVWSGCTIERHR